MKTQITEKSILFAWEKVKSYNSLPFFFKWKAKATSGSIKNLTNGDIEINDNIKWKVIPSN